MNLSIKLAIALIVGSLGTVVYGAMQQPTALTAQQNALYALLVRGVRLGDADIINRVIERSAHVGIPFRDLLNRPDANGVTPFALAQQLRNNREIVDIFVNQCSDCSVSTLSSRGLPFNVSAKKSAVAAANSSSDKKGSSGHAKGGARRGGGIGARNWGQHGRGGWDYGTDDQERAAATPELEKRRAEVMRTLESQYAVDPRAFIFVDEPFSGTAQSGAQAAASQRDDEGDRMARHGGGDFPPQQPLPPRLALTAEEYARMITFMDDIADKELGEMVRRVPGKKSAASTRDKVQ